MIPVWDLTDGVYGLPLDVSLGDREMTLNPAADEEFADTQREDLPLAAVWASAHAVPDFVGSAFEENEY